VNRIYRAAEALGLPKAKQQKQALARILAFVLTFVSIGLFPAVSNAATLGNASVALSDPRPSQTNVSYTLTLGNVGSPVTASAVKCIQVFFSTTSTGNTAPTGFSGASVDTSGLATSSLVNSSASGWSVALSSGVSSAGQDNIVQYTNATGVTPSTTQGATLIVPKITNSSVQDTNYWVFFNTYGNTNCTASPIDNAIVQYINTNGSTLSLTVDDTLSFTVNAVSASASCDGGTTTQASTPTTIPFGTVTAASNGFVCQNLTAATNATNGYTVYTRYTAKPTNALGQTIADTSGTNQNPAAFSAPGFEAYGYTTNDAALSTPGTANRFTSPSQLWAPETTTNEAVGYEPNGVTATTFEVAHQVGISLTTHPGTYSTTIIYTCTPIY
jgi:hypothetical protein